MFRNGFADHPSLSTALPLQIITKANSVSYLPGDSLLF
jgi:hypothetical protein